MLRRSALLLLAIAAFLYAADFDPAAYRSAADRLIAAAMRDENGLARLEYLCDRIGNRLSGSKGLEQAVAWSAEEMKRAGLENVRTIPVKVPHWIRGRESAGMIEPLAKPLYILGLGGSIATPPGGITADVIAVSNFDELEKLGREKVQGKIVVYDAPFVTYGQTVVYRSQGASRAARLGAVAALVRSITPRSLRDPHTGSMRYTETDPKIPTAALSVEDAEYLHRLVDSGQRVRVHLEMEAQTLAPADSADVMGEIVGRENPEEIIDIGGHLDSWDVGQGAHDDGAGVITALEAAALIRQAGLRPRRTIRVVFWTNEENGEAGGTEYRRWVGDQVKNHVASIEMDGGAETPVGFELGPKAVPEQFRARAAAIAGLLKSIGADKLAPGNGEADIEALMNAGVPAFSLRTTMEHYFDYHHSQADTFDKIVPEDFRKCVAAMAVMSYVLADQP